MKLSADIGPRPVTEALAAFGRQTGLQLIYVSTIAESQQSKGARAGLTASEALAQLLNGTGLTFEFLNARTVRVFPAVSVVPTAAVSAAVPVHASRRSIVPSELALEEVTVTARRREEEQGRVPISMIVWSQEDLQASSVTSIDQIAYMTPSLQLDTYGELGGGALTNLTIRGVNDRTAPMIGLYLDDTPIPGAFGFTHLRAFPFPFDVQRIEVLRGPQLQLFAEGNQAGAVRYVFNQPSLSEFAGFTEGEVAATQRGDMSYEAGVAVGGPIVRDVIGFRVSAWGRSDGGFIDRIDPFTEAVVEHDANHLSSTSVRAALTLAPSDIVLITPAFTYSSFDQHDSPFFFADISNLNGGPLRNGSLLRQPDYDTLYLGSLKITVTLGGVDLSSLSSYYHHNAATLLDLTGGFDFGGPLGPGYPLNYGDVVAAHHASRQDTFMQELRLASADPNAVFTWDAGVFYSSDRIHDAEQFTAPAELAAEISAGLPPGPVHLQNTALKSQTRLAALGELALRVTQRLTVSAGLHGERTHYDAVTELPPIVRSAGADAALLPRFALSYQAAEHELLYVTAAKGYGSGGFWPLFVECPGYAPAPIAMETLWSYEAGAKSGLLNGRLQLDGGIFHMVWNNTQGITNATPYPDSCTMVYFATPGAATSNGFDLAAQARPSANIRLGLALAYTDSFYRGALTDSGAVITRRGEATGSLPHVIAPWNITAWVNYSRALAPGLSAELRAEDIFRGRNPGPFQNDDPTSVNYGPGSQPDPSTNLVNLRATLHWMSYETALYVKNALDAQPPIQRTIYGPVYPPITATTFRPRTVGLSASWRF